LFPARAIQGKVLKMRYRECPKSLVFLSLLLALSLLLSACGSIDKHLARGEEFLKQRKFEQALMEFRAAVDLDKQSAKAHWGMARAYESMGAIGETVEELRQTVEFAPENLEARAKLGNYFLVTTPPQPDDAEKQTNAIFAVDPNFIDGHILKASILSFRNRPEKEITDALNHAIELNPNRVESYLSLARFYMKAEKGTDAEKVIQKAISVNERSPLGYIEYGRFLDFSDKPKDAEAQFRKAVEVEPSNIEARKSIADFYLSDQQIEKAEQAYKDLAEVEGNTPEAKAELADFYASVGRDTDAIQTYSDILKDTPDFMAARYRLGELYLGRKQYDKVNEQVEKLLAANQNDAQALMLRARVKLQSNNTEDAIKDLEEVLKRQPSMKSALFYMAQARLALGQVDQARAFIGDLEKYHPGYLYGKLLKIQADFTADEPENAFRESNQLLESLKTAAPGTETSAQQIEDVRVRALTSRGLANIDIHKLPEARADLQEVLKLSPSSASAMINLAKVSTAEKNFPEAANLYEKALGADKQNFDALSGITGILNRQKQFQSATERIDAAIQANAGDNSVLPALYYLKADTHRAQNDMAAARADLEKAIDLDAAYLPAYSAYAELMVSQNQIDGAIEQYKKVVERKQSASVYTLIGLLEDARDNTDEAQKNYRKALEITPESTIAANNLAWNIAANDKGNLDEALTLSQTVVEKGKSNAGYYDTLGWIYFKKALYSQAVESLKKAVALDETEAKQAGRQPTPAYRVRLGSALASAGDKTSARKEVEIALQNEKGLSERDAADARNLLGRL
jgi:tetratricopeptide (TPR) repeat protein